MNLITIKIVSGEELVGQGEIIESERIVRIKEPVMFVSLPDGRTACVPFMPMVTDRWFEFSFDHVICKSEKIQIEVANFYSAKYGGIILPDKVVDVKDFKVVE